MNKIKKPAWVLFEQLHVDVEISTRMSVGDRAKLRKTLNSPSLKAGIINMILVSPPASLNGTNLQKRVKVTQ